MKKLNIKWQLESSISIVTKMTFLGAIVIATFLISCKKLVQVPDPVNTITTNDTFSTDALATAALINVYSNMAISDQTSYAMFNGTATFFGGISSDELRFFGGDQETLQVQSNSILSTNSLVYAQLWAQAYRHLYGLNAVIEGLSNSKTVSDATRQQLTGEAKFLRALTNFYLINFFGDIPLVTTTDWTKISTLPRSPVQKVYDQIISDLLDAQSLLKSDYSISGNERIRANKWAATALLARVYLYTKNYSGAVTQSTAVINNTSLFSLPSNLADVFLKNSSEAIFQLDINKTRYPYVPIEGNTILPYSPSDPPRYYLTDQLLNAFETGDKRKAVWVNSSTVVGSGTYFYPFKYTEYGGKQNVDIKQYYMLLRLAEQYLIRAEANAQPGGNLTTAIADLNLIRRRAGLIDLPTTLSQSQVLDHVAKERQTELFAELGHRWFDLKRTDMATTVLSPIKSVWKSTSQLFPIPQSELNTDPKLVQNPGYN